jgi:hypothetical protein
MVDYGNVSKTLLQIIRVIQLGIGWQWYIKLTWLNRYYEQLRVNGKINKIESGFGFLESPVIEDYGTEIHLGLAE